MSTHRPTLSIPAPLYTAALEQLDDGQSLAALAVVLLAQHVARERKLESVPPEWLPRKRGAGSHAARSGHRPQNCDGG